MASQSVLEALRSRPAFQKVSEAERARIQKLLAPAVLTMAEISTVTAAITKLDLLADDKEAALDSVAECVQRAGPEGPPQKVAGSSLQNYESVLHFLPESLWARVSGGEMYDLLDFVHQLGLRNPTEPTVRAIALIILFATEGFEKAQGMSPDAKLTFIKQVKAMLKSRVKVLSASVPWIGILPKTPEQLKREHRSVYDSVYSSHPPVASKLTELQMEQLKTCTRMRTVRSPTSLMLPGLSHLPPDIMQFGQTLAMQMKQLVGEVAELKQHRPGGLANLQLMTPKPQPALAPPQQVALPAPVADAPPKAVATEVAEATKADEAKPSKKKTMSVADATAAILDKVGGSGAGKPAGKKKKATETDGKKSAEKGHIAGPAPTKPKLQYTKPIFWGSYTIYTDVGRRQWRVVEANIRRRDYEFKWANGWDPVISFIKSLVK